MSQAVSGTFANGQSVAVGQNSDVLVIPNDGDATPTAVTMRLTLGDGIDASNTVKTQRSQNNGHTWADQTTYNSAQNGTTVSVTAGDHWRLQTVSGQANRQVGYRLSVES